MCVFFFTTGNSIFILLLTQDAMFAVRSTVDSLAGVSCGDLAVVNEVNGPRFSNSNIRQSVESREKKNGAWPLSDGRAKNTCAKRFPRSQRAFRVASCRPNHLKQQ